MDRWRLSVFHSLLRERGLTERRPRYPCSAADATVLGTMGRPTSLRPLHQVDLGTRGA